MAKPDTSTPDGAAYQAIRNLAAKRGEPTQALIEMYGLEGILRRLAASEHRDRFVLKGGVLMAVYEARRPTRDLDFNAVDTRLAAELEKVIRDVLNVKLAEPDGLVFDVDRSGITSDIRAGAGKRITIRGKLWTARLQLGIDINTAVDPMVPAPDIVQVPTILGGEPIDIRAFSEELVIAEKVVTMMERAWLNTRWRDFCDVDALLAAGRVDSETLRQSLATVANHRKQPLITITEATSRLDPGTRWSAWADKQALTLDPFKETVERIAAALDPLIES